MKKSLLSFLILIFITVTQVYSQCLTSFEVSNIKNISCKGGNDAEITVRVNGGVAPYTFEFYIIEGSGEIPLGVVSATNSTTVTFGQSFGNLYDPSSGITAYSDYRFRVTSATTSTGFGCKVRSISGVAVSEPTEITASFTVSNPTCFGENDGTITVNASGGTGSFSYSKDGQAFQSSNVFADLTKGTYSIKVRDANSCEYTSVAEVKDPKEISVSATAGDVTVIGASDGTITVTATGGTGALTYSSDGKSFQPSNQLTGLKAGVYIVTVKDENGCSGTTSVTVKEPLPITVSTTVSNVSCNGGTDGSITITANGGTGTLTYSKDGTNFQSSNLLTSLQAGSYTITVKDAAGTKKVEQVNIQEPAAIVVTATSINVDCYGAATGSITVTATGGTGTFTYSKDGISFQSNNVFSGLKAGTYTITVKDNKSCSNSYSVEITQSAAIDVSTTVVHVNKPGAKNGKITVQATGGVSPYTYSLDGANYQTKNDFTNLEEGTYTIYVKDSKGCVFSVTAIVGQREDLVVNLFPTNPTCNSASNGAITVSTTGGIGVKSYSKDGVIFQASNIFDGLPAGDYTVIAKDETGGISSASTTLSEPALITISATVSNVSKNSGSDGSIKVTATGGTGALTYSKDGTTFQTSNVFDGLVAGTYTIFAKDANDCRKSTTVTITQPAISITLTSSNVTCFGGSTGRIIVEATGGVGAVSYSKDGVAFQSSNVFNNLSVGSYTVTVKDQAGNSVSDKVEITEPSSIVVSTSTTPAKCFGSSDGTITITASGGTGTLMYSKDGFNFQTSNVITNLPSGSYTITVKDVNNCKKTSTATITQPSEIVASASVKDLNKKEASNGSITIVASGGNGTYTYSIDGSTYQTNNDFNNLSSGTYSIIVKDVNGCTTKIYSTVGYPGSINASATATNATCYGKDDGTITVTATGGAGDLTYSIDDTNYQTGNVFTNLPANNYNVYVKDATSSIVYVNVTVSQPSPLNSNFTKSNITCNGANDGVITVYASGGTQPFSYSKDGTIFQSSNVFSGLSEGAYTISVKDANSCTKDITVNIISPTIITASAQPTNTTIYGGNDGKITVIASGGMGTLNYSKNGSTFQSSNIFSGLTAGDYTITIKDVNNCKITTNATVTQPDQVMVTATPTDATCFEGNNGSISVSASGGNGQFSYSKDGKIFQTSNVFSSLPAGTYTITAKDGVGATASTNVIVGQPEVITISTSLTPVKCNGENNGSITVTANGGTGTLTYSKDGINYQASNVFNDLPASNYKISVKDKNNCVKSVFVSLPGPSVIVASATGTNVSVMDGSDGKITVVANGGTGTLSYSVDGLSFQSSNIFQSLKIGNYIITVKDANGCIVTTTTSVGQPIEVTTTTTNISCYGGNTGKITVTATGGSGVLTYSKDGLTFQSGNVLSGYSAGLHTVTVKDGNGNTATSTSTIFQAEAISLSVASSNVSENGGNDGKITVTASGGTGNLTYSKDGVTFQVSNIFNGLVAGNYTVTVKDENNCKVSQTVIVAQPGVLSATATPTNVSCFGSADGKITVSATGGSGILSYSINNSVFQSSNVFTSLKPGAYSILIKDEKSGKVTITATINEPLQISISALANDVTKRGGNDGKITVTATGGTGGLSYSLDGKSFQTINTFTGLMAGTYTVTVKDDKNCTSSKDVIVSEPGVIVVTTATETITCAGKSDGEIEVTVTGGTSPFTYSLDGTVFQTNNIFTNLATGNYTVTVKDVNGSTGTTTATITEPIQITASSSVKNVTCNGGNNGEITITITGGRAPFTYEFYTLEGASEIPLGQISGTANKSVTFSVNNKNLYDLQTGIPAYNDYRIRVIGNTGCNVSTASNINVSEPSSIYAKATSTDASCYGVNDGTITINAQGGTAPLAYSKDGVNYQSNNVISGVSAGTYTITVKDLNNCLYTTTATINQPPSINVSVISTNVTSTGANDGTITIMANGGVGALTYSKDGINYQADNSFTGLPAGIYSISVRDSQCKVIKTVKVGQPGDNTADIFVTLSAKDVSCNGSDGAITVDASGGTGSYTYSKDGQSFQASNVFDGLTAGNYTVTVKDAIGTIASKTITLTQSGSISVSAQSTNVSRAGLSDGTIEVTASGGTGNLIYSKDGSNYQTSNIFSNLPAGTYTLSVKDAKGCIVTTSATVGQPGSVGNIAPLAQGFPNGEIQIIEGNTSTILSISFSSPEANQVTTITSDINSVPGFSVKNYVPGNLAKLDIVLSPTAQNVGYHELTFTATDNGIPSQSTVIKLKVQVIAGNSPPVLGDLSTNYKTFAGIAFKLPIQAKDPNTDDLITITAESEVIDSKGATFIQNTEGNVVDGLFTWKPSYDLVGKTFTVKVFAMDNMGLTDEETFTITVNAMPDALFSYKANCDNLKVDFEAGLSGAYYSWDFGDGESSEKITTREISHTYQGNGQYQVTLTVYDGDNSNQSVALVDVGGPKAFFTVKDVCLGQLVTPENVTENGTSYLWNFGTAGTSTEANPSFLFTQAGTYTIKLTVQRRECSAEYSYDVKIGQGLDAVIKATNSNVCVGTEISFDGRDSKGTISYLWDFGDKDASGNPKTARGETTKHVFSESGNYPVTLTVNNGYCTDQAVFYVTVAHPPLPFIEKSSDYLCSGSDIVLKARVSNPTSGTMYSYIWKDNSGKVISTAQSVGVNKEGTYSVVISNSCGTSDPVEVNVESSVPPVASISLNSGVSCPGASNGSAELTIQGSDYSVLWDNGGTGLRNDQLIEGINYVTVVGSNGCKTSLSINVPYVGPVISVTTTPASCSPGGNGTITASVTGGAAPYTYQWDANARNQTTATASQLAVGIYSVTVTDANGCSLTKNNIEITSPALSLTAENTLSCGTSAVEVKAVTNLAGATPTSFTYQWFRKVNASYQIIAGNAMTNRLVPGFYQVKATETATGCKAEYDFEVKQGSAIQLEVVGKNAICVGGKVSAVAMASGGEGRYYYEWWVGNNLMYETAEIQNAEPENYKVKVRDDRGCMVEQIINLNKKPQEIKVTIHQKDWDLDMCNATVKVLPEGNYIYSWIRLEKDEQGNIIKEYTERTTTGPTASLLPRGTYVVEAENENGCKGRSDMEGIIKGRETSRPIAFQYAFKLPDMEIKDAPVEEDNSVEEAVEEMQSALSSQISHCALQKQEETTADFETACLSVGTFQDRMTIEYELPEYQYTLYYYDRGGNLTKTVPPEGVKFLSFDDVQKIMDFRHPDPFKKGETYTLPASALPDHSLATTYEYNSIDQLVSQNTPDAKETHFIYNDNTQLRYSQNARQKLEGKYSYTKYDDLSRVIEVGQSTTEDFKGLKEKANDLTYPTGSTSDLTVTKYTEEGNVSYYGSQQRYLDNRVSYSFTDVDGDITTRGDQVSTYYSYDPHGNVEWLRQDIPGFSSNYLKYDYDLVSGNVLGVKFNEYRKDKFFHRYHYDADNRIESVETSQDGLLWDKDASYEYYTHGPLRRTNIGEDKIQGIDYVYTIQGWIKGINHPDIGSPSDPGKDGTTSGYLKDVYGMSLGYFQGDFKRTNSAFNSINSYSTHNLYNGNISSWTMQTDESSNPSATAFKNQMTGHTFKYDKLNRIVESRLAHYTNNQWDSSDAYKTTYSYDRNGNLLTLTRKGEDGLLDLDNFAYQYEKNEGKLVHNKLLGIKESSTHEKNGILNDIYGENMDNDREYTYDEIGNLIKEKGKERVYNDETNAYTIFDTESNISWNVYGKVQSVHNQSTSRTDGKVTERIINFSYDAAGNRIKKEVILVGGSPLNNVTTYYVRDASGNIMATYERQNKPLAEPKDGNDYEAVFILKEQPIYGSDRIGQLASPKELYRVAYNSTGQEPPLDFELSELTGKSGYKNWISPANKLIETAGGKNWDSQIKLINFPNGAYSSTELASEFLGISRKSWGEVKKIFSLLNGK